MFTEKKSEKEVAKGPEILRNPRIEKVVCTTGCSHIGTFSEGHDAGLDTFSQDYKLINIAEASLTYRFNKTFVCKYF